MMEQTALSVTSETKGGESPREDLNNKSPPDEAKKKTSSTHQVDQNEKAGDSNETFVRVEDLCPERDVLLAHISITPHRRIFRRMLPKAAENYKHYPRKSKKTVLESTVREMRQGGVRFLCETKNPAHFGKVYLLATDEAFVLTRVQRLIREYLNPPGSRKGSASSGASVSGTTISSSGSTIATRSTSAPVPTKLILPTPYEAKYSLNMLQGTSHVDQSWINAISVPPTRPIELAPESLPKLDAQILPVHDRYPDDEIVPPKLIGGIESWGCRSEMIGDGSLLESDKEDPPRRENAPKRLLQEEAGAELSLEPSTQRRRISSETLQHAQPIGHNVSSSESPIWVHIARHLNMLERRVEHVEQENKHLRELLAQSRPEAARTLQPCTPSPNASNTIHPVSLSETDEEFIINLAEV